MTVTYIACSTCDDAKRVCPECSQRQTDPEWAQINGRCEYCGSRLDDCAKCPDYPPVTLQSELDSDIPF